MANFLSMKNWFNASSSNKEYTLVSLSLYNKYLIIITCSKKAIIYCGIL